MIFMLPDLDISLMRTFVAVCEEKNVTAAARKLNRTQPAITQQLRRLETALGKTLFDRSNRRLKVSRDGETLLPYARALLQMNDEARDRLVHPKVEGRVVLGIPDLYATYLLPEILARFNQTYPEVGIELHCMRSPRLHDAVDKGELDLALISKIPGYPDGLFARREPLVWVGNPKRPRWHDPVLPLAMHQHGSYYRELGLKALDEAGRRWRVVCVSDSVRGLEAAVAAGLAVSLLARSGVPPEVKILGAAEGLPSLPSIELILRRKPGPETSAATRLANYMAEHLANGLV